MQKPIYGLSIALCFLQLACGTKRQPEEHSDLKLPKITKAIAYKLEVTNTVPPKIIAATKGKTIKAGKPVIIKLASNRFPAQHVTMIKASDSLPAGTVKTYQAPYPVSATYSTVLAGVPEVVSMNKDFYSKEENAESFSSLNVAHGLKYAEVNALLNDRSGNIWMATWDGGGVSKYNGQTMTAYSIAQGLSSEHIFSLLEDRNGNIWMGTDHNGINKFDGKFITRYSIGDDTSNNFIFNMTEDKTGNIWFATINGLVKYDGKSFTRYTVAQGLPGDRISCVTEDRKGNLWVGVNGGIGKFDGYGFQNCNEVFGLSEKVKSAGGVNNILDDSKGNFWIATNNDGLYKRNGNSISHYTVESGLSSNQTLQLAEDQNGNIWIGTPDHGLNKFDGKTFTHYGVQQGLSNESILSMFIDNSGTLWLGTGSGLNRYDGNIFSHIQAVQGSNKEAVVCLNMDKNKNIWIGTGHTSLSKYDGRFITRFTPRQGLPPNAITDILADSSGNIWLATWLAGIIKFDGKTFAYHTTENGLIDNDVIDILQDKKGNIWIGTDGGVSKFDGKYFTNYTTENGLTSNDINCLFEDHGGNLWLGTRDYGLSKFDGTSFKNYKIKNGLGNAAVTCIAEDKNNNLWLGTNGGLIKFDGNYFTHYTSEQGLNGNIVTNLLLNKDGDLWIGTNNGLNRLSASAMYATGIEKEFPLFKKYTQLEGFLGTWNYYKTMVEDESGDIWIGAWDRLTRYHHEGDVPNLFPPSIQLTGIALFNETIHWPDLVKKKDSIIVLGNGTKLRNFSFSRLSSWNNQPENLQLRYDNNYISFQFVGVTTNRPKEVRYKYLLEGLDEKWSTLTEKPEAVYNNLPPGKYTFKVKAANSEGHWSKELSYPFVIRPPWWNTWWAYGLSGLGALVVLALFVVRREKTLRKEKALLEEKVGIRTRELKEEKEKLESTLVQVSELQAQLVEKEKMNERLRISRELHDDIGGTLSGIVLYSHLAENQMQLHDTNKVEQSLNVIQQSANDMVNRLSDIVWAVNPEHNSLKSLMQKLEEYATEIAAVKNMKVRATVQPCSDEVQLPVEIRHNIFLLCKEAINNAVKHSGASLLQLNMRHADHTINFSVADNGKGFDPATIKKGNGLLNMQKRAEAVGATLVLKSEPQQGTVISLHCKITQ